ncbi:hypothetical protein JB92DRAFT_564006 [Gautieria morchelliformis]|nr:hypothetical protein JB92DRAFT_564006 [Gautieria morchelliformis]
MLLSGRGKVQTFRTSRLRQGCRRAYKKAMSEMERPEVPADTNDGTTNRSAEGTASVEPMLHNPPSGATTPAESSSAAGPSRPTQPSPRPVATSRSPLLELQQSPDRYEARTITGSGYEASTDT